MAARAKIGEIRKLTAEVLENYDGVSSKILFDSLDGFELSFDAVKANGEEVECKVRLRLARKTH